MNSCNNTETLCFKLVLNLTNISDNDNTHLLRLSQNSLSYWITMTILFLFISFNLIINILKTLFYFHNLHKKSIEILDFTNEDEYHSLSHQEFQLRYGQRTSITNEKPYHLYKYLAEQ
jgi:hypothetical protein